MKVKSHYLQIIREYKSVLIRFMLLIFGLLLINFAQAQVGSMCSNAIQIQQLPYSHSGDIIIYGNNYGGGNVPSPINNPYSNTPFIPGFLEGPEVVYRFIPEVDGFVDLSFSSTQLFSSLWVFVDCPFTATIGWDYKSSGYDREILNLRVYAGETYYFVLSSSKTSANYSFDFEIEFTLPGQTCEIPIEIGSLPYSHSGKTSDYGSNYTYNDAPVPASNPIADGPYLTGYLNAPEVVYSYTASADGYVHATSTANGSYNSMFVFTGCPFQYAVGWDYSLTPGTNTISGIPVVAGQTYYFVIGGAIPGSNQSYTFTLEETEGLLCVAPIEIGSLPYNHSGDLADYGNNYDPEDLPPAAADAVHDDPYYNGYLDGNDVVYSYTPQIDGYVFAMVIAEAYNTSLFALTGCPLQSTVGWDFAGFPEENTTLNIPVLAGETYYFVLSSAQTSASYEYYFELIQSVGLVCEAAVDITEDGLPVSASGTIEANWNNYNANDVPPASADAIHDVPLNPNYLNGAEVVVKYTALESGYIDALLSSTQAHTSLWVFSGCPFESTLGWDYSSAIEDRVIRNIPVSEGETYYFALSSSLPELSFYAGLIISKSDSKCEAPLDIQSLPYIHDGAISDYGNNYSATDVPLPISNPVATGPLISNRMNGYDVVYEYTPLQNQNVDASFNGGGEYMALWVFTGCPFQATHGWDLLHDDGAHEISNIPLLEGETYYFVVSCKTPSPFDFTFQLTESSLFDCPILEKDIGDLCDDGLSSTEGDYVRENCDCAGYAMTAAVTFTIPPPVTCGLRYFRVDFYVPGTSIKINTVESYIYESSTVTFENIPVGEVTMRIAIDGALLIILEDQIMIEGTNLVEINDLIMGDINGDIVINFTDFSIFSPAFGTSKGDENYNHLTDFNCDSNINFTDFTVFGANFGIVGVSSRK